MNVSKKTMLLLASSVLMVAAPASAAVMVGAAGEAWDGNTNDCFRRDWGRIANTGSAAKCASPLLLTIGVPAATGARNFTANGNSYGGGTSCAAIVTGQDGWNKWWSGQVAFPGLLNGNSNIALGSRSVGTTDGVLFECSLANTTFNLRHLQNVGSVTF